MNALREAIAARSAPAVTEALLSMRHAATQQAALLNVLNESTAPELRGIERWAEDWLSQPTHHSTSGTADANWQAMHSVYQLTRTVLQTAGIRRTTDRVTT